MNTDLMKREQLSALADGELQGEELAQALQPRQRTPANGGYGGQ